MDTQKLLEEKSKMEYHKNQFDNFGHTFVESNNLEKVLKYLRSKTDFFKFVVEINHGGFYIHNLADF